MAAGHGDRKAVIYASPVTDTAEQYTYAQLQDQVSALAHVLRGFGVAKGDRVVIYMPMVPQAIFAMLARARLGAIQSVVFGGFAPRELATRIENAALGAIISASCGIEPGRMISCKPLLDTEEVIASHLGIAECAVVGKADALKGQMPLGLFVTNDGADRRADELEVELIKRVRAKIGAVAAFKCAFEVKRLPKTRSGKVLHGTVQMIADAVILDETSAALRARNLIGPAT